MDSRPITTASPLILNATEGKTEEINKSHITLLELLKIKGVHPDTVAVEMNMEIIDKKEYAHRVVSDQDTLEVVRFVGGGI